MAKKTNCTVNGVPRYRLRYVDGKKLNKEGLWVDNVKNFYGDHKSHAEQLRDEYIAKKRAGLSSENQYFGVMAQNYIENVFIHEKLAKSSKTLYLNAWEKHVAPSSLASMRIEEVRGIDLQSFYNSLDCYKGTLSSIHKMMKYFFRYLDKEGFARDITHSIVIPEKKAKTSRPTNEIPVYSDEDIRKAIKALPSYTENRNMRLYLALVMNTGLRISELLGLRYNDIENGILHVQRQVTQEDGVKELAVGELKTNSSDRKIPLSDELLSEISLHKQKHSEEMLLNKYRADYIFTTSSGRLIDRHNMNTALKRFHESIGVIHKGTHAYRSTLATKLHKAGEPLLTASKVLGHGSTATTAKYYVNIDEEEKRNALKSIDIPAIK
jgi:integrase